MTDATQATATMEAIDVEPIVVDGDEQGAVTRIEVITPSAVKLAGPVERALAQAKAFVIAGQADVEIATEEIKSIKRRWNALEEERTNLLEPARTLTERIMGLFRNPQAMLKEAETTYKTKLVAWNGEQERRRREEAARQEEARRKEQQRLMAQAAAAAEKGKAEQAEAKMSAAAALDMAPKMPPPPPKVQGLSEAMLYDAEVTNKIELLQFIVSNPMFANLVEPNQTALRAQAKAMKESFSIPGCKLVRKPGARVRV